MSGADDLTRDVEIDIGGLLRHVWRRKLRVVILMLVVGAIAFAVLSSISPRYRAVTQILIEQRETVFTRTREADPEINRNRFDEQAVRSQVEVIASDDIAQTVIGELNLSGRPEFRKLQSRSAIDDVMVLLGLKEPLSTDSRQARVLAGFRKRLDVGRVTDSRVIRVAFWANERQLSQQVANGIADEFLRLQRETRSASEADATAWLEPEIRDLREKVRQAEARVAEFRASSDILIANNDSLLATQQLSEVSTELSRIRAARSSARASVESVRAALDSGASFDVIPEVVASPLIQRLRERQVALRAQISELSTTLLPNHPRLKALQSQVADFEAQIRASARDILVSLVNNETLLQNQEDSLVQELNRLKAEAGRVGEAEVELRALEREAESQRNLLETYLTRYREAAGRQGSEFLPVNARVISRATLPTSSFFPKVVPLTVAAMAVTVVLAVVTILAGAMLGAGVAQPAGRAGQPMPHDLAARGRGGASAGLSPDEPRRVTTWEMPSGEPAVDASGHMPDGEFSTSLAVQGILSMGSSRIAVISPAGDDGSITTWLVARKLADQGKSVAVMDMTGSGITTDHMLGDTSFVGVRDVLAGEASIRDIVHQDRLSSVNVLAVGVAQPTDPSAAIGRLSTLVTALADTYDYLIIDCGLVGHSGLVHIADDETIVLISGIATQRDASERLEGEIRALGYSETVTVCPSDGEFAALEAAA